MPGPGNKHLPYSETTSNPQILKQTREEMLENIEEDVELINVTLKFPEATFAPELLSKNKRKFKATTKKLRERIENPTLMGRYDRAYKLYYEKVIYGDFFKNHLAEKYPRENPEKPGELINASLNFDEKHRFHRINTAMVQPDKSYKENYEALTNSDPAKAMSILVDEIMNSDISDLYTTDMDRFLDFVERNKITLFTVIGELDTMIEQDKIFLDKVTKVNGVDERSLEHGMDTNSPIMQYFAQSEEHPDGLTKEQINYILEHRDMFGLMATAAGRIYDLATPFPILAPDDPLARAVLALGADFEQVDDDKSIEDYPNSVFSEEARKTKFYKNVPCQSVVGFYDSYSYQGAPEDRKMKKVLEEHPEISANGWLNADFSGFTTDEHGEKIHLTKQTAIFKYIENPDSVKFELNDFGERKKPDREKNRNLARGVEQSLEGMEKILKDIYGSKWNASQEFNDLVTYIREFEKIAAEESKKFSPNMPLLSRNFKKIQAQANAYITKKEADLKGAQPNRLRKLRMDFAKKIMSLHEPLYKDNKIKEFEDKLRNEQKELRNILNDMESDKPQILNPRIEMVNRLSRMLAIEHIMTDLKLDIDGMEFNDVDEAVSDKNVNEIAETVKEMPTFAKIVDEINRVDDADLKDMMEEFASSKDGKMFAKGGILDVYNTVFAERTVDVQQGAKGTFANNDGFKGLCEKQDLKYTSALNRLNQYVQSKELPDMGEKIAKEVALIVGLHLTDNKLKDAASAPFDDKLYAGVKRLVDDTDYTKVQDELMAEPAFREVVNTLGKGPFTVDDMNKLSDRCLDVVAADRAKKADEKAAQEKSDKEKVAQEKSNKEKTYLVAK